MIKIDIEDENQNIAERFVDGDRFTIGKSSETDVMLRGVLVSRLHAALERSPAGIVIRDLGSLFGTRVNGKRVREYGPLLPNDQVSIGNHIIRVMEWDQGEAKTPISSGRYQLKKRTYRVNAKTAPAAIWSSRRTVEKQHKPTVRTGKTEIPSIANDTYLQWRKQIHEQLILQLDLRHKDVSRMNDNELRGETELIVKQIIDQRTDIPLSIDRHRLCADVINEAIGLGPLETLLADDTVTEVMVNRHDEVFVERVGRLQRYPLSFTSERTLMSIIERIVAPVGRRIDESSPMVDARLKDGSRVNAVIPPLALKGPSITIRKFSKRRYDADDLIDFASLTPAMVDFLRHCVSQRKNIVIAGGTGSGKTTLLNVISNFVPADERIVTIEDSAELRLDQENLVALEARPPNLEGRGIVTIRDLVKNSLRMRPDRIVIGECRGGEALDMLQAMNTGHDGSLTTIHANSPRDALSRLEVMVLMAGMDLPVSAIREQIASAVDIIVQQTRYACGARKVTHITEITGVEAGKVQMQDIFLYRQKGLSKDGEVIGDFIGCDVIPSFYETLNAMGVSTDLSIFKSVGRDAWTH